MSSKMHTAMAAWMILALLGDTEEESGYRKVKKVQEEPVKLTLLPGYNQAYVAQDIKVALEEPGEEGYNWKLSVPKNVKIIRTELNDQRERSWVIEVLKPGRYKIVVDYANQKRPMRIKKRVLYEVEALPCPCKE